MLTRKTGTQLKVHFVTIEDLVPQEHFLRKVEKLIDFSFIYNEVEHLYCSNNGRPSIDPVSLIKYLLIGFLYGINSERRIEQEIQVNVAYRWFLGLELDEKVPHHSTISQLRRRKFNGTDLFRKIFEHILAICMNQGLIDGKLVLTDSTHVKANTARKSEVKVQVEKGTIAYWERLNKYEEIERKNLESANKIHPKRQRPKPETSSKIVEKTVSTTDPDAGLLNRPGKPGGMHYLDHQSIDAKNGIIIDVAVTAGNMNDSIPYLDRVEYIENILDINVETVAVDSGYDSSLIHKVLEERRIVIFTPKRTALGSSKVEFKRENFRYNETDDTFTCPNGIKLKLRCLQRSDSGIMYEYRAAQSDCKNCLLRDKCLAPSQKCRKLQVNIFEAIVKQHHANDNSQEYRAALRERQIWCEGTFAAQKRAHNLKQLFRRGIEAAETHCLLSATALNLKRMMKCVS